MLKTSLQHFQNIYLCISCKACNIYKMLQIVIQDPPNSKNITLTNYFGIFYPVFAKHTNETKCRKRGYN